MKKILLFCLFISSFVVLQAQGFEWKRLSDDIVDSIYYQYVETSQNISLSNQNYYLAYTVYPYRSDPMFPPSYFKSGYFYPAIISQSNQIMMADTFYLDSVYFSAGRNIVSTFIQNNTFRVLVNYAFLDSANYNKYNIYRKGVPVPKTNGFLLVNYSLTGNFLGYDSLMLPLSMRHLAHYSNADYTLDRRLFVSNISVDSNNQLFLFLKNMSPEESTGWTSKNIDTVGFIVKYSSNLVTEEKVIPVIQRTNNGGDFDRLEMKMHNNNLYLLGQINDTTIVDNQFFASDSVNGYNTFAIEFNPDLYVVNTAILPGTFYDFSIDNSNRFFVSGGYNYPIIIGNDSIFPTVYMDPYDTVVQYDALLMRLSSGMDMEKFVYILSGCKPPSMYSNNSRVFGESMGGCGRFVTDNNDTIDNPIVNVPGADNLFLFNTNTLIPTWQYNFPVGNRINGLYFFDDKMIESYSTYYYFLAGFGDQDTLFLSGDYDPVAIAQIGILGLGLEEQLLSNNVSMLTYPNPASDYIQLLISQDNDCVVDVYDINGKIQLQSASVNSSDRIDVSFLKPGIYVVRAIGNSGVYIGKFLKE